MRHLTGDLFQAEKKVNVGISWTNAQNYIYFTKIAVIFSVAQLVTKVIFLRFNTENEDLSIFTCSKEDPVTPYLVTN